MLHGAGLVRLRSTTSSACATTLSLVAEAESMHPPHLLSPGSEHHAQGKQPKGASAAPKLLVPARSGLGSAQRRAGLPQAAAQQV